MDTSMLTPENIAAGAAGVKTAFQAVKDLLGVVREAKDLLPDDRKEATEVAIVETEKQLKIAEVQIAGALGYQLCRCEFPPHIMLRVGYMTMDQPPKFHTSDAVYECPKCHDTTAGGYGFQRTIASPELGRK